MNETLVSILPLVDNRDEWKRRAILAEARLAEFDVVPKGAPHGAEYVHSRYTYTPLDGSMNHHDVLKTAIFDLARALLDARCVHASIVDRELKLSVIAIPSVGLSEPVLMKLVDQLIKG